MSKYLDELTAGLDEEYLQTLREAKLVVMKTRAKNSHRPETFDLATEALKTLKELEQKHLQDIAE